MSECKQVKIHYLSGNEAPPADGMWLLAVHMPDGSCELIVSMEPDTNPVTFHTGMSLDKTLHHASAVAAEFGVETIYVLGTVN